MTEQLTASSTPAGTLFSRFRFVVPEFQREYAWTASDEVSEFFSDLKGALATDFYFLGLVVLTGTGNERQVVDGQQRILTLSLLAAALRSEALQRGRTAAANQIDSTFLRALNYDSDQQVHRVTLASDHDGLAFARLISDKPDDEGATSSESTDSEGQATTSSLLDNSHKLLSGLLAADLDDSPDPFARIGVWTRFVTESLHFAVFDHPDQASAYRVFEVINTRGRGLTPSDLIKNYVLSKASPENQRDWYDRWVAISERFRSTGSTSVLPQFIRHSISARQKHIQPRDLYDYIASNYKDETAVGNLLSDLESDLDLYAQILDPSQGDAASDAELATFAALNQLAVVTLRPILLALHATEASDAAFVGFLQLVVRRMVVGNLGTGSVERRLGNAAGTIAKGTCWKEVLTQFDDLNPSQEEFINQLSKRSLNKRVLQYIHSTASLGKVDVTANRYPHLQQIRPRKAPEWASFDDEEAAVWAPTVGNCVLAAEQRRPRNSNTWENFKTNLLPTTDSAGSSFLKDRTSWGVDDVKQHAKIVAEASAVVWYGE